MRKFVRADSNTSIAGSSVVCGSEADDDPAATAPVTSCTMLATLLDSSLSYCSGWHAAISGTPLSLRCSTRGGRGTAAGPRRRLRRASIDSDAKRQPAHSLCCGSERPKAGCFRPNMRSSVRVMRGGSVVVVLLLLPREAADGKEEFLRALPKVY